MNRGNSIYNRGINIVCSYIHTYIRTRFIYVGELVQMCWLQMAEPREYCCRAPGTIFTPRQIYSSRFMISHALLRRIVSDNIRIQCKSAYKYTKHSSNNKNGVSDAILSFKSYERCDFVYTKSLFIYLCMSNQSGDERFTCQLCGKPAGYWPWRIARTPCSRSATVPLVLFYFVRARVTFSPFFRQLDWILFSICFV